MRKVICSHPWHTTLLDNAITQVALPSWLSHRHLESAGSTFENFPKTRLAKNWRGHSMHYGADAAESSMSLACKCQCKQSPVGSTRSSVLWKRFRIDVGRDQIIERTMAFERARIPMATAIALAGMPFAATQDPYTNKSMTNACVGQCSIASNS